MNISITLYGGETDRELTALAALIASLRGETAPTYSIQPVIHVHDAHVSAAPAHATSDDLMREEAARAAGRPIGSPSSGEASPAGDSSSRENPEGAPDRDADGLPWDERIHSGNKATNADGTWRKRRGVDEVMYGQVVAELQAAEAGPTVQGVPGDITPVVTLPAAEPIAPPPPPAQSDAIPNAPAAPATASPAPPPPPPAASAPASAPSGGDPMGNYRAFMGRVSQSGHPYAELDKQAQMIGLAKFTDLVRNLDRVDEFAAHLEAMGLLAPAA